MALLPGLAPERLSLALALFLGYFTVNWARTALDCALPALLKDPALATDARAAGAGLALATACNVIGKLLCGPLVDGVGGAPVLLGILTASALTALAVACAPTAAWLWAAWCVQETAAAACWPAVASVVGARVSPGRQGEVWGLVALSSPTAVLGGRLVNGGLLGLGARWRGLFGATAGVAALAAVGALGLLRPALRPAAGAGAGLGDPASTAHATSATATGPPLDGDVHNARIVEPGPTSAFLCAARDRLRHVLLLPDFWLMALLRLTVGPAEALQMYLPLLFARTQLLPLAAAAVLSGAWALGGTLAGAGGGALYDRWSVPDRRKWMAAAALGSTGAAAATTCAVAAGRPLPQLVTGLFLLWGLTLQFLTEIPLNVLCVRVGGAGHAGSVSALQDAVGNAGEALALWYTGALAAKGAWRTVCGAAALGTAAAGVLAVGVQRRVDLRDAERELVG